MPGSKSASAGSACGRPDDRTRSSAGATTVASGRSMGWYATSSAKPSDSQTGTLRVVEARTVTWVSSWVMTTSRPSGRSELHAPGTRTIRSAPACSPGVSGPSVAAATPARSSGGATEQSCGVGVSGGGDPDGRSGLPPHGGDTRLGRARATHDLLDTVPGADGEHERGGCPADDEAGEVPGLRAPGRGRGGDDEIGRARRVSLEGEVEVEGSGRRVEAEKPVGEARLHVPLDLGAARGRARERSSRAP